MNDDPMSRVPAANRLSLRAVLVSEGQDPSAALAEAGIVDAIAIPVVMGEEVNLSGGILGDGLTPNVVAVLETVQEEGFQAAAKPQPGSGRPVTDAVQPATPGATTLPAAFGVQPLAPVRTTAR